MFVEVYILSQRDEAALRFATAPSPWYNPPFLMVWQAAVNICFRSLSRKIHVSACVSVELLNLLFIVFTVHLLLSSAQTQSNHIDSFFARWPTFDYDRNRPLVEEFCRMTTFLNWKKKKINEKKKGLRKAVVLQFEAYYGTDAKDINAWKSMCLVIGIDPLEIPNSLTQCRKVCV